MTKSRDIAQLKLLKTALCSSSRSSDFYSYLLSVNILQPNSNGKDLLSRTQRICDKYAINLVKFVADDTYNRQTCKSILSFPMEDGLMDSAKQLLSYYDKNNQYLLNTLLKPF